jgi:glycosyltransferase involved in cell wall biosynthesis
MNGVELFSLEPKSERWAHWRCVFSNQVKNDVLAVIDAFEPDVVHAHTISRQCGYRWMPELRKRGITLIVTCHDVSHVAYGKVTGTESALWLTELKRHRWTWNPLRTPMIKKFLRSADKILTVSDALKEYLTRRGLTNLETLHNGIDLTFWKPSMTKEQARAKLNLPHDTFLFLLAGRMGVDKGSTLIAKTLPKNASLVLAGDRFSDEFAPVKDRIHVFHHQSADEMKLQYTACDAVLVPSKCLDCFPTVCLEAMAMERMVLATTWGGAKESVKDGVTGYILDPLNETPWHDRMQWCIDHKDELARYGTAGRKRMQELFGLEMMIDSLKRIYKS